MTRMHLIAAVVACGFGCSSMESGRVDRAHMRDTGWESGVDRAPLLASCTEVQALRDELLQQIASSPCSTSECAMVDVQAQAVQPSAASLGQRILLIDDGVVVPAATRYANRTLAYLERGADGVYSEVSPQFSIASDALAILTTLNQDAPEIPAEQLSIAAEFFPKFSGDTLPAASFGHGTDMLPFLAEMVPDAQFVVSDDQLDPPADCEFVGNRAARDRAFARLRQSIDATQDSLSDVILAHDIHAVHLAWGLSYESLDQVFEAACGDRPNRNVNRRIMQQYADLFRALTSLETEGPDGRLHHVVLFQAGAFTEEDTAPEDALDCAAIDRRVRVFHVPYDGTAVPREGSHDQSLLPAAPRGKDMSCNDVFVVMGYRSIFSPAREGAFFGSRPFGLGLGPPAWPAAPSFATPIALAHYFNIQREAPEQSSDEWLAGLTREWSAPILDPLLYADFPRGVVEVCDEGEGE